VCEDVKMIIYNGNGSIFVEEEREVTVFKAISEIGSSKSGRV
jgi:hypothetical protein